MVVKDKEMKKNMADFSCDVNVISTFSVVLFRC